MRLDKYLAGDYLSATEVSTGDKIKFLNGGEANDVQGREVMTFKVLTQKKEEKKISPNKTSLRTLSKKWSTDTDEWIGKIATIKKEWTHFKGEEIEVIYLLPEGITQVEKSETAVNAEIDEAMEETEVETDSIPF